MTGLPTNVSDSVRKLNPHLYLSGAEKPMPIMPGIRQPEPKKIIRVTKSAEEKLNKTERRFLVWLRQTYPHDRIGIQDITVRIGADCRLTPDFSRWNGETMSLYDVKGPHTWEDSKIKLKAAASIFPIFRFYLAWEEGGVWQTGWVPN